MLLEEQGVVDYFLRRLDLPVERQSRRMLMKWKEMADRFAASSSPVLFLVGRARGIQLLCYQPLLGKVINGKGR